MKRHVLVTVTLFIAVTALVLGYSKFGNKAFSQTESTSLSDSLHDNAKKTGHHVVVAEPSNMPEYNDVQALTKDSLTVVTGRAVRYNSHILDPKGRFIVTDYRLDVRDVIKGDVKPGDRLHLTVAGGRVQFDDGTSAEVKMPSYWKDPEEGKDYVFFLMRSGRSNTRYELVGGPQGLFEVSPATKVLPQVRAEAKMMQRYRNTNLTSFLNEVRRAAKEK